MLERTHAGADPEESWQALLAMGDLFRIAATRVAAYFGYEYPHEDDRRVSAHLRYVRDLPRDASEMY